MWLQRCRKKAAWLECRGCVISGARRPAPIAHIEDLVHDRHVACVAEVCLGGLEEQLGRCVNVSINGGALNPPQRGVRAKDRLLIAHPAVEVLCDVSGSPAVVGSVRADGEERRAKKLVAGDKTGRPKQFSLRFPARCPRGAAFTSQLSPRQDSQLLLQVVDEQVFQRVDQNEVKRERQEEDAHDESGLGSPPNVAHGVADGHERRPATV